MDREPTQAELLMMKDTQKIQDYVNKKAEDKYKILMEADTKFDYGQQPKQNLVDEYRIHSENIIEILNFAYSQRSNMKDPIAHIIMDVIINFKKAVENKSDIYIIYERKTN